MAGRLVCGGLRGARGYHEGASAERVTKARTAALKALELDGSVPEAHMALGVVKAFYDWGFPGAEEAFKRALALNPNSAIAHDWYGYYLLWFRRWDEATAELGRAVELDPVSAIIGVDLGWALVIAGRRHEAIAQVRKIFELDPKNVFALGILGWAYMGKGIYKEALATFEKRAEASRRDPSDLSSLAAACVLTDGMVRALQLLGEIKEKGKSKPGKAWNLVTVYRALASRDHRYYSDYFLWLEKASEEHSLNLVWTSASTYSDSATLHSDPRWVAFRKKLGLPP